VGVLLERSFLARRPAQTHKSMEEANVSLLWERRDGCPKKAGGTPFRVHIYGYVIVGAFFDFCYRSVEDVMSVPEWVYLLGEKPDRKKNTEKDDIRKVVSSQAEGGTN